MPSGFGRGAAGAAFTLVLLSLSALPASAVAGGAPPRLSHDNSPPDISSTDGSGNFGQWFVDRYGLPAYRYNIDQQTAPQAAQPELAGNRDAWSQLGNDHIVANAYNHGYVQLWSEDRLYQWMNFYDPSHQHYAGGYGYLNVNGHVLSTLYDDGPAGASTERDFGAGYYEKHLAVSALEPRDAAYAPFGNDSILLHDVTLTNSAAAAQTGSYFEYWDVNPEVQGVG